MKISEEQLKAQLEELYSYYFKMAKRAANKLDSEKLTAEEIRAVGAVDAVGAIYLFAFGGKAMMELWMSDI